MKIDRGWRPWGKGLASSDSASLQKANQPSFSDMLGKQDQQRSQEELKQKMQQIELQGKRLSNSMTIRELRQYKLLIKQFLGDTVRQGVGLKETRGWDRRGRGKRYHILDQIDEMLLGMADELLENERGRIDLLNKVGEIRGMLINLFF